MSYILFLWKSSNAHGVHSPFVYSLVTNGFYEKERLVYNIKYENTSPGLSKLVVKTLLKTIAHFKSYKLIVLGDDEVAVSQVTETIRNAAEQISAKIWFYSTFVPVPGGVDLAYLCGNDKASLLRLLAQLKQDVNNNTVAVVANIHASEAMEAAWEAIKKDPNVIVTVDTYHLGLIFFRREQTKQHFIIRPYKSVIIDALLGIRNLWGLIG